MLIIELGIIVFLVVIGSALCSCSEAALASISLFRVQQLAETKKKDALALHEVKKDIGRASNTIVVFNNVINIVGSMTVTAVVIEAWGTIWLGVCSGILTMLIILFAEVIPKVIGYTYSEKVCLLISRPLKILIFVMAPVLYILNTITEAITRNQANKVTERDVLTIIKAAYRDGKINDSEYEIAKRVFFLNDKMVGGSDTPRTVMTYLKAEDTLKECLNKIIKSPHSRMPIIGESIDNVIGIALKQELMTAIIEGNEDKQVKDFSKSTLFAYKSKSLESLLREFMDQQQHMAIVLDEYGGVEGVITLEDILEELMGKEIVDETDRVDDLEIVAREKGEKKLTSTIKKQKVEDST
ncbi:hemolysin family protein [Candidatus Uabimicrobium sp. HlEnr_7]|uniref:hemolysin family protein n=1 Tax=Candidatus Uabimicrobium helgolandensis TaxID=3095367 RepID=UPI00355901E8